MPLEFATPLRHTDQTPHESLPAEITELKSHFTHLLKPETPDLVGSRDLQDIGWRIPL